LALVFRGRPDYGCVQEGGRFLEQQGGGIGFTGGLLNLTPASEGAAEFGIQFPGRVGGS
jgi:hypothetical protein